MTNIQSAIAEIQNHTEHTLKTTITAQTSEVVMLALQEKQERDNPQPLTLEQLKTINADVENRKWVYVKCLVEFMYIHKKSAYYQSQIDYTKERSFCCGYTGAGFTFNYADYGKTWLAYDHKPKEQVKQNEIHKR